MATKSRQEELIELYGSTESSSPVSERLLSLYDSTEPSPAASNKATLDEYTRLEAESKSTGRPIDYKNLGRRMALAQNLSKRADLLPEAKSLFTSPETYRGLIEGGASPLGAVGGYATNPSNLRTSLIGMGAVSQVEESAVAETLDAALEAMAGRPDKLKTLGERFGKTTMQLGDVLRVRGYPEYVASMVGLAGMGTIDPIAKVAGFARHALEKKVGSVASKAGKALDVIPDSIFLKKPKEVWETLRNPNVLKRVTKDMLDDPVKHAKSFWNTMQHMVRGYQLNVAKPAQELINSRAVAGRLISPTDNKALVQSVVDAVENHPNVVDIPEIRTYLKEVYQFNDLYKQADLGNININDIPQLTIGHWINLYKGVSNLLPQQRAAKSIANPLSPRNVIRTKVTKIIKEPLGDMFPDLKQADMKYTLFKELEDDLKNVFGPTFVPRNETFSKATEGNVKNVLEFIKRKGDDTKFSMDRLAKNLEVISNGNLKANDVKEHLLAIGLSAEYSSARPLLTAMTLGLGFSAFITRSLGMPAGVTVAGATGVLAASTPRARFGLYQLMHQTKKVKAQQSTPLAKAMRYVTTKASEWGGAAKEVALDEAIARALTGREYPSLLGITIPQGGQNNTYP